MVTRVVRRKQTNIDFDMRLGKHLRKIRLEQGYRLIDVQVMTGLRFDHISRMELGDSRVSAIELMELSIAYQLPMDEILKDVWPLAERNIAPWVRKMDSNNG